LDQHQLDLEKAIACCFAFWLETATESARPWKVIEPLLGDETATESARPWKVIEPLMPFWPAANESVTQSARPRRAHEPLMPFGPAASIPHLGQLELS